MFVFRIFSSMAFLKFTKNLNSRSTFSCFQLTKLSPSIKTIQIRDKSTTFQDSVLKTGKEMASSGVDFSKVDKTTRYKILCASILPRPIALVSSLSKDGLVPNLAIFAFFMPVTSDPPTLAFSVTRKSDHSKKDTLVNIEETGHFVVNHLPKYIFDKAFKASKEFPSEVNEFEAVGLTPTPSLYGLSPCVLESPISLECKLYKLIQIGTGYYGSSTLVVGEVIYCHFRGVRYKDGRIDARALQSVSRLEGMNYGDAEVSFAVNNEDIWSYKHW